MRDGKEVKIIKGLDSTDTKKKKPSRKEGKKIIPKTHQKKRDRNGLCVPCSKQLCEVPLLTPRANIPMGENNVLIFNASIKRIFLDSLGEERGGGHYQGIR